MAAKWAHSHHAMLYPKLAELQREGEKLGALLALKSDVANSVSRSEVSDRQVRECEDEWEARKAEKGAVLRELRGAEKTLLGSVQDRKLVG